jgi:DNA sulfur modification protein DndC
LREVCGEDDDFFQLQAALLDVEREFRGMSRRAGIYDALEDRLRAGQYGNESDAISIRRDEEQRRSKADEPAVPEPHCLQRLFFSDDGNFDAS